MKLHPVLPILAFCLLSCAACPINVGYVEAADDDRERPVMERFRSVLERSPRRGTALDRVYGFHVERGELETLLKSYRDRLEKDPKDGAAWLLLGLVESQRGRDAAAVAAFRSADACRLDDPLPAYYLGQALVMVGQPAAAVEAFERALTRRPSRNDLLEIFQALGRVHQRARRDDQAMAAWTRLETLFPDDPRVQEQIASSLAEDAKLEPALARYEAMAGSARDPYRRIRFRTEAADLKVKLGRQVDALRDYEGLLAGLDHESWIFREVRRKIEDVFHRDDDQAGLTRYYERWLEKAPEDIDAMSRLAKALAGQGRAAEARSWLDKALKLAPSSRPLRLALIEQLANERNFAAAAAQYEAMAKLEAGNPDIVRDWGKMLLRDTSKPESDRKRAAAEVWQKLVDARPDDPSTASQVADLLRQAGLVDEAISLYKKALAMAPGSPQYREYLGEYYHQLKRPDDALAAWRGIADGPNRDASSVARLGEVLAGFGYKAQAIEALEEAIRLDPASFPLRLRLAGLLLEARRFEDADIQLVAAEPLAEEEERREELLGKRIAVDEASGRLADRIEALKAGLAGPDAGNASAWGRLARYAEVARRPIEATVAAEKAVAIDGKSISARATLARLYEATGRFAEAADASRALARIDRRSRSVHLSNVAQLEVRLGRKDEALNAGREVLAASPGNPEALQLYADLCFQLGENEEGLQTLRKAARANETDVRPVVNLAEALAREFRTEEAIELFWKAFEKSDGLDARLGYVARLADLHLRRNQFERLTARLERLQAEDGRRREATLFLAQAHATLGDFGTARHQLEGLLEANARDTALLKQLSKLAEDEGDLAASLKFQRQLNQVAPSNEATRRLADLAVKAGEIEVAEAIWASTTDSGQDLARVLSALDNLASNNRFEVVLATTSRLLRSDPGNWELLQREARTLTSLGRPDEAAARYRAILDLRRDDDEPGAIAKARSKGAAATVVRQGIRSRMTIVTNTIPAMAGLTSGYPSNLINSWAPDDFGAARATALAHELARARRSGTEAEWLAARRRESEKRPVDPRRAWDDFYVTLLLAELRPIYESAKDLLRAVSHDPNAGFAFLNAAINRNAPLGVQVVRAAEDAGPDLTPPLPNDEVDLVLDALRSLLRSRSQWIIGPIVEAAMLELRRSGRLAEFDPDYRALVDSANDYISISVANSAAADRGDAAALLKLSEAFYRLPTGTRLVPTSAIPTYSVTTPQGTMPVPAYHMARAMKSMADSKRHGEMLQLIDDEMAAIQASGRVAQRARIAQLAASTLIPPRITMPIFTSNRAIFQTLDYPAPNRYLDMGSILLLRSSFTFFKRDNRLGEFVAHFRKAASDAAKDPSAERYARLALSGVLWWAEDRESAVRELVRAVELSPGDVDLKLLTAELRAIRREPEEALAVVDSIEAVDQDATRRRELLALRLAVQTGRDDRARQAAERLFGLRLDSTTQVQLAAQMHQLGMHDLADAVLARARRQVGNNTDGLLELMAQYRRQGNLDVASQVAMQVLRRSTGQALRVGVVNELPQRQAMEVLAGSGKLKEMIERVEGQVRTSPQSLALQQTLAAYYRAAGQLDKLKATNEAILKLRPGDTPLRMQVATQLAQAGDLESAIGHYRAIFQNDPSMLSVYSTAIFNTFQQANRTDELVTLLDQVGLKTFNDPISIRSLVTSMLKDSKTFDQGSSLLIRALEAYPNDRVLLLGSAVTNDLFWTRADAYDLAKSGVLPRPDLTSIEPWAGLDATLPTGGSGQDGKITTLSTRLLAASTRLGKLDDLAASIEAMLARQPGWLGGKGLLSAVRIRQGRVDEGRVGLEKLLADPATSLRFEAFMVLGQEIREIPDCRPLAITFYERASRSDRAVSYASLYIKPSTIRQLALLYRQTGQAVEALAVARKAEESFRALSGSAAAMIAAYYRVNYLSGLGTLYHELGDPADALRVADELLGATDEIQLARTYPTRNIYPSVDSLLPTARETVDRALNGLDRETLTPTLGSLLKPGDPSRPVDLQLVIHPREVDQATVRSLLVSGLDLASRDSTMVARLKADLDSIATARPNDIEVRVAATLAASLGGDPGAIASAAGSLDRLLDETPLGPISPGTRLDARARDEAARRLGVWLVARVCWNHDWTAELGDRVASKALEAARRLPDPTWAMAMLREAGKRAIDRGDRPAAEARWASMLDMILADGLAPVVTAPSTPAPTGRPTPRPRVPALSVARFRQSAELATLAAGNGLTDLSLKAVRESLKGGPPILPVAMIASTTSPSLRANSPGTPVDTPPDPTTQLVEAKLIELDTLWTRAKLPPELVYETLRDVVFPPARPSEVFLYDPIATRVVRLSSTDAAPRPGELAKILARRAIVAGRLDDLRRKVADRNNFATAKEPARQLLAAIEEAVAGR